MSNTPNTVTVWVDDAHSEHVGDEYHPEHPARIEAIMDRIYTNYKDSITIIRKERGCLDSDAFVKEFNPNKSWSTSDGDTYETAYTNEIVQRVTDMIIDAATKIVYDGLRCGFVLARPPGHHASTVSGPRGFCHQNNVWNAVEAFAKRRIRKIAILDWDVHHGDGTEACVIANINRFPDIRFVSIHAYGHNVYPGTGNFYASDNILNIPLRTGTKALEYLREFDNRVIPFLDRPDVLIVSAGYDAHKDDPMKLMRLETDTYGIMSERLKRLGCPVLFILEGGYNPEALADSVAATIEQWM